MSATDNISKDDGSLDTSATTPPIPNHSSAYIQLEALRKLSRVSNDAPTFEVALADGLAIVAETLEVEQAVLLLYDEETHSLIPHAYSFGSGEKKNSSDGRVYFNSDEPGLALQTFRLGIPQLSNDCINDPRCNQKRIKEFNVRNQIAAPVKSEHQKLGVCLAINKTKGIFTSDDLELLETLTVPLANLLKNINLVKRLENQQRRHLAVLDAAVDGFIEVDRNFKITVFNKGAENLTGWKAKKAIGRTCTEVLMPHNPEGAALCITCPLKRAFRTGQSVSNVETLIKTKDGEDNWTACSYNAVMNERGEVVSGVIAIKDIYRLKALGDELQQQIQQQQSLLGVINAISGLSNMKEIYRRALDEVRKAIQFDVGTIHAVEQDGKVLRLVSQYQQMAGEPQGSHERGDTLDTLEEELDGIDTSLLEEYNDFQKSSRYRNNDKLDEIDANLIENYNNFQKSSRYRNNDNVSYLPSFKNTNNPPLSRFKSAASCEALCQNEPYMAVNLPGKEVCPVLSDFPNLQSHICIPIKSQDHTYGVLHLASYRTYAFWGSDFSLSFNICKQIGVAAERASLFEKIEHMARTDPLTKLYNKAEFWERLNQELKVSERHNQPLTLMVLDLDRLKWFNDNYGHVYGDLLISDIAKVIRQKSRASDIAFRFGGDELCLLLPRTSTEEAWVVAERIRVAAADVSVFPNQDVIGAEGLVTMSIGMASYPHDAHTSRDLFLCADAAQYRAKNTGKNRVCIYDFEVDYKDLNSRRRNPNDYDPSDTRLSLPAFNPNDNPLYKNRLLPNSSSPLATKAANTELDNTDYETDFEIDPDSQYDIEILPDPSQNPPR